MKKSKKLIILSVIMLLFGISLYYLANYLEKDLQLIELDKLESVHFNQKAIEDKSVSVHLDGEEADFDSENEVGRISKLLSYTNSIVLYPHNEEIIEKVGEFIDFSKTNLKAYHSKDNNYINFSYNPSNTLLEIYQADKKYIFNDNVYGEDNKYKQLLGSLNIKDKNSVLALCNGEYIYMDELKNPYIINNQSHDYYLKRDYKLSDLVKCDSQIVYFSNENLLKEWSVGGIEPLQSTVDNPTGNGRLVNSEYISFDLEEVFEDDSIKENITINSPANSNIYYVRRYKFPIEQFSRYLLSFDYQAFDKQNLKFGYRFITDKFLNRITNERVGNISRSDTDFNDIANIDNEETLEGYTLNTKEKRKFEKVISTKLENVIGIEIFLYAETDYPANYMFSGLSLKKEFENQTLGLSEIYNAKESKEHIGEVNLANTTTLENNSSLGVPINASNYGSWNHTVQNCSTVNNVIGETSQIIEDNQSDIELSSAGNNTACNSKKIFIDNQNYYTNGNSDLLLSFEADSELGLAYYSYSIFGEYTTYTSSIKKVKINKNRAIKEHISMLSSDLKNIGKAKEVELIFYTRDPADSKKYDSKIVYKNIQLSELGFQQFFPTDIFFEIDMLTEQNPDALISQNKDGKLIILDKDYSDKYYLKCSNDICKEKPTFEHYKISSGQNLWLIEKGVIEINEIKVASVYSDILKYSSLIIVLVAIILFISFIKVDLTIKVVRKFFELFKKTIEFITKVRKKISSIVSNINKFLSGKIILPIFKAVLGIKKIEYKQIFSEKYSLLKEVDGIIEKMISDVLNAPVVWILVITISVILYFVVGVKINYVGLLAIFLTWFFYRWDSRVLALFALTFLTGVPFLLVLKKDIWAERFAVLVYFFLVMTVILQIREKD